MTNPKRQIRDYYNCFKGTKLIIAKLKWMLLIVIYQKQRHNHANDKKRWKKSALFSTIQIANSVPETQSCIFPWFQSAHPQSTHFCLEAYFSLQQSIYETPFCIRKGQTIPTSWKLLQRRKKKKPRPPRIHGHERWRWRKQTTFYDDEEKGKNTRSYLFKKIYYNIPRNK